VRARVDDDRAGREARLEEIQPDAVRIGTCSTLV
jgi:hypothetical protein